MRFNFTGLAALAGLSFGLAMPAAAVTTTLSNLSTTKPLYKSTMSADVEVVFGPEEYLLRCNTRLMTSDEDGKVTPHNGPVDFRDTSKKAITFTLHSTVKPGKHTLFAYSQCQDTVSGNRFESFSNNVPIQIGKPKTRTTLEVSGRLLFGAENTLTAVVENRSSTTAADGTATFLDGTKTLAKVPVVGGKAELKTRDLAFGNHQLRVRFDSDAFAFSQSAIARVVVDYADGPEQIVNVATTGAQVKPAVAYNPMSGGALVVWESRPKANGSARILGRLIGPDGMAVGKEISIATGVVGSPAVAATAAGDYYVVYEKGSAGKRDIYRRKIRADGRTSGLPQRVNKVTGGDQFASSVTASNLSNGYTIAWQSTGSDGDKDGSGIVVRFYDPAAPTTTTVVNTTTAGDQAGPTIFPRLDNRFLVTWTGPTSADPTAYLAAIQKNGKKVVAETKAAPGAPGTANATGISMADTSMMVAWEQGGGSAGRDVFAARFDATGKKQGFSFNLDVVSKGDQFDPALFPRTLSVMAAWAGPDADGSGIWYRELGTTVKPMLVNASTAGAQSQPAIAPMNLDVTLQTNRSAIVVWTSDDGATGENIRMQKLTFVAP